MATLFSAGAVSCDDDALACGPTVDGQVAQGCTRGTLHLDVGVLEQEQDGLEGIAVDFAHVCRGG